MSEEVQVKDKVQEKGSEEPRQPYSYDELKDALENDPALRSEFMKNEDKFITVSESEKSAEKVSDERKDEPSEDAVSVLVKPSWLGSYGKNRKPDEAIQEMAKGNSEKDKTINYFKDEKIPGLETELQRANEERASLKKQISDFEKNPVVGGDKKTDKPAAKEVVIPDLPEGDDMFLTEEGQKKFRDHLAATNADRDNLRNKVDLLEKKIGDVNKKTETVVQEKVAKDGITLEFEAVNDFRKDNPTFFKKEGRETREIEKDYISFMKDLASVKGVSAFAKDGKGYFSKEASDALSSVLDENSQEGKSLREKLQERNIGLPDDFGELQLVYAVRDIRSKKYEKNSSGEFVPITYSEAFKIYRGSNGNQDKKMILDARKQGHEDLQKAIDEKNDKFAKETPSKGGANPINVESFPTETFMKLVNKGARQRTSEEDDILRTLMKAKQFPDSEIQAVLKKPTDL